MIYGDTDSIMIYTGLDDITKAKAIAGKVIQEVGFNYILASARESSQGDWGFHFSCHMM